MQLNARLIFFQAKDGIRDIGVTGVQTCALPICRSMGDHAFLTFMDQFGRAHAGRAVTSAAFLAAAEKAHGKTLEPMKEAWLNGNALAKLGTDVQARKASGRFWSVDAFERQLDSTLIIYGTLAEADAQREAAVMLQRKLAGRWAN